MRLPEPRQPSVFVSFGEADRYDPAVTSILNALSYEFNVTTKEEGATSEELSSFVARQIELSRATVIILTHQESPGVFFELGIAASLGKRIIVVAPEHLDISPLTHIKSARILRYANRRADSVVDELLSILLRSASRKQRVLPKRHPERFELLVARVFESLGYDVFRSARAVDPGIDILASADLPGLESAVTLAIECKFTFRPVGVESVEVASVELHRHGNIPVLVTNSTFTQSARASGEGSGVLLIDGRRLERLAVKSKVGPETLRILREELEILGIMKPEE